MALTQTQIIQRRIIVGLLAVIVAVGAIGGWIYATTPNNVRNATQSHFHARLQVLVDGRPENFATGKYQTDFNKDICTASLTNEPVHFHDGVDQFLHIHWNGITGGEVLKNYGWNFIGGPDGFLGMQTSPKLRLVPIHGLALPVVPKGDQYYIYTGDQTGYHERSWQDFLHQDLASFLGSSTVHDENASAAKLNDFRGNIVIFAQKDKPSDQQIKNRFGKLLPLPTSACSG